MKEYKVGDTVYVKGKIIQIDEYDTPLPYCVDFVNGLVWIPRDTIIDELPTAEPVKPVLPKGVADELEHAKKNNCDFYVYLDSSDRYHPKTYGFTFGFVTNRDAQIKILSDAWYNGYTVEKEKKYNLILGTDSDGNVNALVKTIDGCSLALDTYADYEENLQSSNDYQFTQSEIDKYNKDFWIKSLDLNDYKVEVSTDED